MKVQDYTKIQQNPTIIKTYGLEKKSFSWPYLSAKGPNGELLVGNNSATAKHIVVFDKELKYLRDIGSKEYENDVHKVIHGIAVSNNRIIYVTEGKQHCVQKFRFDNGEYIGKFGKEGSAKGQFRYPAGLLVTQGNILFVCDRHNHRIQVFQSNDKFFYAFGTFSPRHVQKPGTFHEPVDLAMNSNEQLLFITDWRNSRIQAFEPNGNYLWHIIHSDHLRQPNGIFFTPDNHLLVSSTDRVLIFKEDGTFVSVLRGGNERFADCIGIVMMDNKKIVICDGHFGTNRLVVFETYSM